MKDAYAATITCEIVRKHFGKWRQNLGKNYLLVVLDFSGQATNYMNQFRWDKLRTNLSGKIKQVAKYKPNGFQ